MGRGGLPEIRPGGWRGLGVNYHSKRRHVHVASAFPLAHHYRAVFGHG
jgi:hypothetical protein